MSKNAPVVKRFGERVHLRIWANQGGAAGRTFFTAEFYRTYQTSGGQFQDANTFGYGDLLELREYLDETIATLRQLSDTEREQRRTNSSDSNSVGELDTPTTT